MNKWLWIFIGINAILIRFSFNPALAQDQKPPPEPDSGAVVCPPGVYLTQPEDCIPTWPVNLPDQFGEYWSNFSPHTASSFET
jgi:hypothetical protein